MTTSERCCDSEHCSLFQDASTLDLLTTYMAFTFHAQNDERYHAQFHELPRDFLDNVGSDEALGQDALGVWIHEWRFVSPENVREVAHVILNAQRYTRPTGYP